MKEKHNLVKLQASTWLLLPSAILDQGSDFHECLGKTFHQQTLINMFCYVLIQQYYKTLIHHLEQLQHPECESPGYKPPGASLRALRHLCCKQGWWMHLCPQPCSQFTFFPNHSCLQSGYREKSWCFLKNCAKAWFLFRNIYITSIDCIVPVGKFLRVLFFTWWHLKEHMWNIPS